MSLMNKKYVHGIGGSSDTMMTTATVALELTPYGWVPLAVLVFIAIVVWIPNMIRKDKSLSRYPEFEEYRQRSYCFIPLLF